MFGKEHRDTVHALRSCGHSLVGLCLDQMYPMYPGFAEMVSDLLDTVPNVKYLCFFCPFDIDYSDSELDTGIIHYTISEEEHRFVLELVNSKLPRLDTFIFENAPPLSSELDLRQDFELLSAGHLTLKRYISFQEVIFGDRIGFNRIEYRRLPNDESHFLPDTEFPDDISWLDVVADLKEG